MRVSEEAGIPFLTAQIQQDCNMIINPCNISKYRKLLIAQSIYRMYKKRKEIDKANTEN